MELNMDMWNSKWSYRELFVRILKDEKNSIAYVTNDGWGIDNFIVQSNNEEEFIEECKKYLDSERFKEKMRNRYA